MSLDALPATALLTWLGICILPCDAIQSYRPPSHQIGRAHV